MAGLIEKMNSLPKQKSVNMEDLTNNVELEEKEETQHDEHLGKPASKETGDEEKPAKKEDAEKKPVSEEEPAKNATKAEKDAYKARRVKDADEEKAAAKAEADKLKKELEDARKEKDDWKKQAETVASNRQAPTQQQQPRQQEKPAIDINKDPVRYLANGLDEVNKKFQAMEHQNTVSAAQTELEGLEVKSSKDDYKDVMEHAVNSEVAKMKIINPNMSEAAVRAQFKADKVKAAVMFIAQGKDPIEGLYDLAKAGYGYQPKQKPADDDLDAAKVKADGEKARFDAVNKNKKKAATGLSAGGSTGDVEVRGPQTTKKRTLRDFAKLTKSQKDADYIQE